MIKNTLPMTQIAYVGAAEQELWMDLVSEAASDPCTPAKLKEQLARMAELGNVPRQEKKFKNFVKNSLRLWNDAEIEGIWKHLEGLRAAQRDASAEAAAEATAAAAAAAAVVEAPEAAAAVAEAAAEKPAVQADAQSSSKKRKRDKTASAADTDTQTAAADDTAGDSTDVAVVVVASAAPDFAKAAKKALKSAGESGLSVKELRKAVLAALIAGGCSDSEKALKKQFTAALDAGFKHVALEGKTAKLQKKQ
jgi:alkylhydroperoxidase/carboxymuconolactone decarboxylase family protein YurZ